MITSVNGFQYTKAALWWAAANSFPVTLNLRRGHRELEMTLDPATRRRVASLVWKGDPKEAAVIQDWLGLSEFRPERGQVFALDFYENFHGIETML